MGGTQRDTGRNVNGLKNTVSMLLETRGIGIGRSHIQRRVHSHVTAVTSALRRILVDHAGKLSRCDPTGRETSPPRACCGEVVVEAGPTPTQHDLLMLDPETGANRSLRVDWNSLRNLQTRKALSPCGYWLARNGQGGGATETHGRKSRAWPKLIGVGRHLPRTSRAAQNARTCAARRPAPPHHPRAGHPTRSAIDVPSGVTCR